MDTELLLLNAIEPGSVVPIHRHQKSSETLVVLRGRVVEEYYDDLELVCWLSLLYWEIATSLTLLAMTCLWHVR